MPAALLLMLVVSASTGACGDPLPWTHTRAMSPATGRFLRMATERSGVVRALVEELERTDVVVLLDYSNEPGADSKWPFMTFLTAAAGIRYVAIQIYWKSIPPLAQVPLLAHELQHALELAAAPDVRDRESCVQLFARIGWPAAPGCFETDAARLIEKRVREELDGQAK